MFQPIIPDTGLTGWRFLQRTYDTQFEVFSRSTQIERDADYFRENIASIGSAEDLVKDRQLLNVTLGAFGLQDDINNRFFIQKVLEEGTTNSDSLANRFSDTRYSALSEAFGFGPSEVKQNTTPEFAENMIARFQTNSFEVAAGNQNSAMRSALYAERTLVSLAGEDMSNDAKWFTILGEPPLRQVVEKALNLPPSVGQIDIDQQLDIFKDRARVEFGSDDINQFTDPDILQDVLTKFILRDQLAAFGGGQSSTSIALTLLSG